MTTLRKAVALELYGTETPTEAAWGLVDRIVSLVLAEAAKVCRDRGRAIAKIGEMSSLQSVLMTCLDKSDTALLLADAILALCAAPPQPDDVKETKL